LQARVAQTPVQSAVGAPVPLAVDEQAETLFKAQPLHRGVLLLLAKGLGHSAQPHGA
jgi:hypothetical protein